MIQKPVLWGTVVLFSVLGVVLLAMQGAFSSVRPEIIPTLPNPYVGWRTPVPVTIETQRYEHPTGTFAALYPVDWGIETAETGSTFKSGSGIQMDVSVQDNSRSHAEVVGGYLSLSFAPETQIQQWSETENSTLLAYAVRNPETDEISQTLVFIDTFPQYTYVQTIILDRDDYTRYYDLIGLLANNVEYIQGQ